MRGTSIDRPGTYLFPSPDRVVTDFRADALKLSLA
jgi:hypothetical protein